MWAPVRKILAKSERLSSLLGDVLFETPSLRGQSRHSVFQWRVKRSLDEHSLFVSLRLIADGYAGPESKPTSYINFDLATAERIRADLDVCIAEARQLAAKGGSGAQGV
jgi:hypothetical protein